ncbi:MAG: thermonuclease family protein [Candidatus Pacebacteria bacterium]|nr:thermonuclease family protein [Candidatus Paceibacterota bacterium]
MKNLCKRYLNLFIIFIFFVFSFLLCVNDEEFLKKNIDIILKSEVKQSEKIEVYVHRVVDGDTVILNIDNKKESVRLIGLNTPEVKNVNDKVVECFGKEAGEEAKRILKQGQRVFVEYDESQSKRDKYDRLLAYVFLESGENFAEIMIRNGYGYENTFKGLIYKYQKQFIEAQKYAQKNKLGLWADGVCFDI